MESLAPANASRQPVISADSHVTEPESTYRGRLPAKYADMAPRIVRENEADVYVTEGIDAFPITVASAAGMRGATFEERRRTPFSECYAGGWDPRQRLLDQDLDGLSAEVLYPSLGMFLCRHPDIAFKAALFAAYNEWMAEFCATDPDRLLGLGQAAIATPAAGVAELRRIKELGLRGVMLPGLPGESDYFDPIYDPFWEAATDLELPLSFHVLAYKNSGPPRGSRLNTIMNVVRDNQDMIGALVFGGVFERHPQLKLVCAEADAGWLPHYASRADHVLSLTPQWLDGITLSRKPSEYIYNNIYMTFQDDEVALKIGKLLNPDMMLWASDFPHLDSTFPHSQDVLTKLTTGMSSDERFAFQCGNVAALYKVPVPVFV